MKVQYLVKARDGEYTAGPFSFKVGWFKYTMTDSYLNSSLPMRAFHSELETKYGFSMCLPGEFL